MDLRSSVFQNQPNLDLQPYHQRADLLPPPPPPDQLPQSANGNQMSPMQKAAQALQGMGSNMQAQGQQSYQNNMALVKSLMSAAGGSSPQYSGVQVPSDGVSGAMVSAPFQARSSQFNPAMGPGVPDFTSLRGNPRGNLAGSVGGGSLDPRMMQMLLMMQGAS